MTIKEVARLAGVSPAAVSRYLNGGPLSKDKKERVARAIEETGYRPNLMAKTMRTGRVRQIGIIVPRIYSESVNLLMEGITEELLAMDYLTVLGYSDTNRDRELQYLDTMQNNRVAGIILMATTLTDIKKSSLENCSVPLVITGQNFDGLHCVYHDDFNAMRELTELFIRKGGKKFVYIGAPEADLAAGLARREGAQEALRRAGFDAQQMPVRIANFNSQDGYAAMLELLEKYPDLDSVVCATDVIAHGAMKALREKGRRVPEDVRIAGIGNNWADLVSQPELTTVQHYGLPVITFVFDNQTLGMVRQWQNLIYKKNFSETDMDRGPDFVKLAEAYGLRGRRVNNQKDLAEAIEEAMACGEGYVIDCMLDIDEMVRPMVGGGSHITNFMKI